MRVASRIVRFAGGLIALTLLASACGQPTEADSGPVRLLVFGAPEELGAYRTLATEYQRATGATVQLIEASDRKDLITRLSTSIAGGSPPDLFLMNYRFYGQFASKGAVEPIEDRLASSEAIKASNFYPAAMDAFRWHGKQLCMPQNISSLVVYYNRGLFQKFGVAEPKAGWRWNDLIATATALTRDDKGAVVRGTDNDGGKLTVATYGLGVEPSMIRLAPFVWSNGGEIVDSQTRPTRFTLDTPPAREALRNLLDLRMAYGVVPTDQEVEAEDDESRFVNGKLAMIMSSRRLTPTLRATAGFDWDVAPLPTYGQETGILHADAYCMTTGSKHKDAAWRFMEFALGEQGQKIVAGTGRTVPSNIAVATSPAFLDPASLPRSSQVFLNVIPVIRRTPTISTWPEIEDVTSGILENALYRGDPLDDVIREIDEKTRPLFSRGDPA